MSDNIFADDFKTTPYWWDAARPNDDYSVELPQETEVAVVGSGYSGLSAALELSRAGTHVTVLEQNELGWGASSRNGGMLSTEPKFAAPEDLTRRFGAERAVRMLEDGRATFDNLKEIVDREGIECHLQQHGRFVGAHSPAAYRTLESKANELKAEGLTDFDLVPRERVQEYTESEYYYGGLFDTGGGCLHPALYHRGVLDACQRYGATLCSQAQVQKIERTSEGFIVHVARGGHLYQIRAREVVVGTNGYTGDVTPWHKRRLVPLGSYIIATEELPVERIDSMFRNFCTMSNTQRILFYYRPSPDHRRVLFGGRASFRETDEHASSKTLYEYLCAVFPNLRGVEITHGWSGNVAFTFDHLPHMGVHEGMHYCMGCNGSGVQMMSFLGRQIALKILGRTNRPCGFDGIPFETRPMYSGNPWFLPVVGNWYRMRDRLERLLA
ncbi:MAG: glycine/D-amino acid oxidase-like deaminating enzyme [Gammaproteobacteria bacterium]|jgi:glycine/D-amino acid oxidase-like deaminating enzyme